MKKDNVQFGRIRRVLLIGGSRLLAEVAVTLRQGRDYEVVVFSSKRHLEESASDDGQLLKDILSENDIPWFCEEDINRSKAIGKYLIPDTLAIAMGAPWVFEKSFVKRFSNPLLDFMGIDLPRYRGGAHYTWQILLNNRKGCCNLQVILGGEETFHRGPIVKRKEYALPATCRTPLDYFHCAVPKEQDFINEFLSEIKQGKNFPLQPLDEKERTYYPFLYTKINGWIDWRWDVADIERMMNAFDEPYAGASTSWAGKRVFVKGAKIQRLEPDIHPFAAGIVIRIEPDGLVVMAKGGLLKINKILDDQGKDIGRQIREGDRLVSKAKDLEAALQFRAVFDAKGLKK